MRGSNTSIDSGQAQSATAPRSNKLIEAPNDSHVSKKPRQGPLFGGPLFGMHPKPVVKTEIKVRKDTSASGHGMIPLQSPLKLRRQYAKLPAQHLVEIKKQVDIAFRSVNTPKLLPKLLDSLERKKLHQSEAQPLTADDARTAHAAETTKALAEDESEYSIGRDKETLYAYMQCATQALKESIPSGTLQQDWNGFKWVVRYCQAAEPPILWMRPHTVTTDTEKLREVHFTIHALIFIARNIEPCARRMKQGYQRGQPSSALLSIYGYRRCCATVVATSAT